MMRRTAGLLGLVLMLQGCAGMPLAKLWPFQRSDTPGLARAEPEQVRVALRLPLPARPRPDGATLVLRLSGGEHEPQTARLAMTLVNEGRIVRVGGLPSAGPGYWWYLFKLTSAAEDELQALQSGQSDGTPGHEGVEYEVAVAYENVAAGQSLSRNIRLQLASDEGFFMLTEGVHTVGSDAEATQS